MIENEPIFDAPIKERLMIYPEQRQKLFMNLLDNYKVFIPHLKLIYASLNYDAELKSDYLIIFETVRNGITLIVWDSPFIYTNRCIPAYRYAVKNNLHSKFFENCKLSMCQMDKHRFEEFIRSGLCDNLSTDSKSPKYWMSPANANSLLKGLSELGMRYRPPGFVASKKPDL